MTNSYAGVVCLTDPVTGNRYKAIADTSALETRVTALENKESLAVTTVSFTSSNWTQEGSIYQYSVTGCDHVLKIYKIVDAQREEVPMVKAIRTGTKAFTLQAMSAFTGEILIA